MVRNNLLFFSIIKSELFLDKFTGTPSILTPVYGFSIQTWDDELARQAQQWADQCIFYHDGRNNYPLYRDATKVPYASVGQNIYAGSGMIT